MTDIQEYTPIHPRMLARRIQNILKTKSVVTVELCGDMGSGKSTLGMMAAHYILWPHTNEYTKLVSVLQLNRANKPRDIIRGLPLAFDQVVILDEPGTGCEALELWNGVLEHAKTNGVYGNRTVCMIMTLEPLLKCPDIRISFAGEDKS